MDVTMESLLGAWWDYQKRNLFTAIPAVIVGVRDLEQCRVDVKPLVNMVFSDFEDTVEWPTVLSVPLMFPSSSTTAFTFPVQAGDTVLCVFSQKSLDVFKSGDGTAAPPNDYRMFDKRDAVAIPGLWPFGMSKNNVSERTLSHSVQDTVVVHNLGTPEECELRMKPDGEVKVISPLKVSIQAPVVNVTAATSATVQAPSIYATASTLAAISAPIATVTCAASAAITAPILTINSTTSVAVTSPTFTWNGLTVQAA